MFDVTMKTSPVRPKNFGSMKDANAHAKIKGPCGDTVQVWLRIDGGKIRQASFITDGCGYSQYCCGTAAKLAEGMKTGEAAAMTQAQVLEAAGEVPEDHRHCALLAANTVRQAVDNFLQPQTKPTLSQWLQGMLGK